MAVDILKVVLLVQQEKFLDPGGSTELESSF